MGMRVIGGTARGMKLDAPPGEDVRPLSEMARAAMFNILRNDVEDAAVLDLFAGAGTVGIEALSRGAKRAVFVELAARHKDYIEKNLRHTRLDDRAEVIVRDAFRAPELLARRGERFGIIYIGPPFPLWQNPAQKTALVELFDRLVALNVLALDGVIVVQSDLKDILPEETKQIERIDRREYGRNVLTFYRRRSPAETKEDPDVAKS